VTTRLVLLSHAPTAATRHAAFPADEPLDQSGLAQATAAAGTIRRADTVYCAPAVRCTQTAAALGLTPVIEPALRDCDHGRWSGHTLNDIEAAEPDALAAWLTDPAAAPHGGESVMDLLARATAWLHNLQPIAGTALAVTHPAIIRALIIGAIQATPASFWRIDVAPLTTTVLKGNGGRWTLRHTGHRLSGI
jgi:broad specificity phosphatase PhoE